MKVAIVGSRDYCFSRFAPNKGEKFIRDCVAMLTPSDYVVSGGARGADWWANEWATEIGIGRIIHMADWLKYGKSAGPIRNALIVADADCMLAFYSDKSQSKGTKNSVEQARKKGIPVYEFDAATEAIPSWLNKWHDEMVGLLRYGEESPRNTEQPRG